MPPPAEAFGHSLPMKKEDEKKKKNKTMGPPDGAEDMSDEEEQYAMVRTSGYSSKDLVRKYSGVSGVNVDPQTYKNLERDSIRRHAQRMLDIANENGSTSSCSEFSSSEEASDEDKDTNNFDIVPSNRRGRRIPAALAGINYRSTTQERSYGLSSTALPALPPTEQGHRYRDTESGFQDEHLDSVPIALMHNVRYQDDAYDTADATMPYSDYSMESKAYNIHAASWGSRFSRDTYRNDQRATLDKWDREHDMENKGGAQLWFNTFRSKTGEMVRKKKVFGPGFSFRKNQQAYGQQQQLHPDYAAAAKQQREQLRIAWHEQLRIAWQDPTDASVYDEPSSTTKERKHRWYDASVFDESSTSWKNVVQDRQKQRGYAIFMCLCCFLAVLITILSEVILAKPDMCPGCDIGDPISIYALSDTPYSLEDAKEVFRSITLLPQDADFLVHLGNFQDASVTLCNEKRYDMAADLFKRSSLPVFAVPGNEDWVECIDPDTALDNWRDRFVDFEQNFDDFGGQVYRNRDYPENFAVLRSGVLFFGLHMVSGPSVDPDEWEDRRVSMLKFYFGMVNMNLDNFRAVVMMGNSSEKPQLQSFFDDFFNSLEPLGKPVLYLHANEDDGTDGIIYQPFPEHPTLFSIQVNGQNAATRIDIGEGNTPFSIAEVEA